MSPPNGGCGFQVTSTLIIVYLQFSIYLIGHCSHCSRYFEIYVRVYKPRKRKMWCPVDIRDYEQWSCDQESECVHVSMSESSKCDFVLLELLTLVASRNTINSYWLSSLKSFLQICAIDFFANKYM